MHLKFLHRIAAAAAGLCTAAVCLISTASAETAVPEKLPFDLNKPPAVSLTESKGKIRVQYTKSSLINKWSYYISTQKTQIKNGLGLDDLYITAQVDWTIDSYNDWHYNAYWDNDGYDENWNKMVGSWAYLSLPVTAANLDSELIFHNIGNPEDTADPDWNGTENAPGWKAVLKDGQYEIVDGSNGKKQVKIDLTKHAICVRLRWKATMECDEWERDQYKFSPWSDIAVIGNKDAITDTPSQTTASTTLHTAVQTTTTTAESVQTDATTLSSAGTTDAAQSGSTISSTAADGSQSSTPGTTDTAAPEGQKQPGSGWIWAVVVVGFIIVAALCFRGFALKKQHSKHRGRKD